MSANFPIELDTLVCPSSGSKLNEVPHAELHCSESDQIAAIQTRVGVTGSTVPTTIDFELHDTSSGHDHDGINSRPTALGPDCNGNFSGSLAFNNGFFTEFSSSHRTGCAIDKINKKLLQLDLSGSASSGIAFETQNIELTSNAIRVNFSGSGVSGTLTAPDTIKYTIPEFSLRQNNILADCGPFESFDSPMYHHIVYEGNIFVSSSTWYTNSSMTLKIFQQEFIRDAKRRAIKVIRRVYLEDGSSIKSIATDIVTFKGMMEISRSRTIN